MMMVVMMVVARGCFVDLGCPSGLAIEFGERQKSEIALLRVDRVAQNRC